MKYHFALFLALISGATVFTACSSDDDDAAPSATDSVRLTKMKTVSLMPNGDTLLVTSQNLTWEDRLLKRTVTTMHSPSLGSHIELEDIFVYDGTNCTEIHQSTGRIKHLTYADGRLRSAISTRNDETTSVNVTGYTADGHIGEMTIESTFSSRTTIKKGYSLTWENGDLVRFVCHPIEPAGEDETYTIDYSNAPSPYIGFPLGQYIWTIDEIVNYGSKHCNVYNKPVLENGRVVMETINDSKVYFYYSDGTGSSNFQ